MSRTERPSGSGQKPRPRSRRHHIVAIVVPGMSPLEISVASEFLGIDHGVADEPWYRFTICTPEPGLVMLHGGLTLQIDHGLEATKRADTVLLPGWCERAERPDADLIGEMQA